MYMLFCLDCTIHVYVCVVDKIYDRVVKKKKNFTRQKKAARLVYIWRGAHRPRSWLSRRAPCTALSKRPSLRNFPPVPEHVIPQRRASRCRISTRPRHAHSLELPGKTP